ncbi:MAG: SDR family oxidoreductase [Actinomycetota bacterium]|nr:SDR family oxidoreductase [Actinomycetota bacterium]
MDLGICGRRAAVAAASSGLGRASAKALAAEGARVVICGRDRSRVDEAAADIGGGCVAIVCDVSDGEGGTRFVREATEVLGTVDLLVTNGGGPPPGTFAETALDAYPAAIDMNLMAVVAMCKAAVPSMVERGFGRVVSITSLAVRQPMANLILSNTARAGVTGMLKTLAREVAGSGVTVNSVQPGLHRTPRVTQLYGDAPQDGMGDPDDFGQIVAFLCSEQAGFLTGAQIHVDGGAYQALL